MHVLGNADTKPLSASFLPPAVTNPFDSFNPVVAGVVLIASAFFSNGLAILLAALGAAVAFGGHKLGVVPAVEPLKPGHLTAVAGSACGVVAAVAFGRRSHD